MGLYHSPRIVTDGLVLYLDAANTKGYDKYENLITYSEQFDNSNWNNSGYGTIATITSNTTNSPDATLTSDLINFAPDGTNESRRMQLVPSMSGTYTFSVFVKKNTLSYANLYLTASQSPYPSISYNFDTDIITGGIGVTNLVRTLYSDGWVRISGTATVTNHTGYFGPIGFDTGSTYYWGAQLERGSSVTDYYATTSTAKTRGTTWTDLSLGGGNNGTLVNGPTYSSSNRGSIVFDGTNDYVTVEADSSFQLGNGYTLCAWVKSNNNPSNYAGICGTFDTIPSAYYGSNFSIQPNSQKFHFLVGGSSTYYLPASATYTIGQWYYLVGTILGAECKFYIDGTLNTTYNQPSASSAPGSTTKFKMGRFYQNIDDYYFNGNISNCGFYNRVLTATEIQKNFNAQRGRFGI